MPLILYFWGKERKKKKQIHHNRKNIVPCCDLGKHLSAWDWASQMINRDNFSCLERSERATVTLERVLNPALD